MQKLRTMEKVVYEILQESKIARKDDYFLMVKVCEKLCPDLLDTPFGRVMTFHNSMELPNWETVTRVRRRLQRKYPELAENMTRINRKREERRYRNYSKV